MQGLRDVVPRPGTFDPVEAGGQPPPGVRYRRESSFAMGQRDRGVSVPALPPRRFPPGTRALVVYGAGLKQDRGPTLATHLGAEMLDAGTATHWDMVREEGLRGRVAEWLHAVG